VFAAKVSAACSCWLTSSIVIFVIPPKCVFRSKSLVESLSKKEQKKKRGKKRDLPKERKCVQEAKERKLGTVLHLYLEKSLFVL